MTGLSIDNNLSPESFSAVATLQLTVDDEFRPEVGGLRPE